MTPPLIHPLGPSAPQPMNIVVAEPLDDTKVLALVASNVYPAVSAEQQYDGKHEGKDPAAVAVDVACRIAAYSLVASKMQTISRMTKAMMADINRDTRDP